MVRILDLYCGMGGLSLGFALALEDVGILGFDIDVHAIKIYNYNLNRFNTRAVIQDILKWDPRGEYDVIIGGPPCQPFSIINTNMKKQGREHPLYPTLPRFFDIVLKLKPKVFLMENVKGLVTRRYKHLLDEQLKRLEPYYRIKWQVLNAAYYGVPQRRERLFVFGIRKDLRILPNFPNPTHGEREYITVDGRKIYRWITVRETIGDLLSVTNKTITEHVVVNTKIKIVNPKNFHDSSKVPNKLDLPAKTIIKKPPLVELSSDKYRRLTIRECLRLQSFPDWWRFPTHISISKKYELVGETVPPILSYRLAIHIGKLLGWKVREPPKKEEWQLPYFHRSFTDYLIDIVT